MRILTGIDIPFNPFGGSPLICDDWYSAISDNHEVIFLSMPPSDGKRWWKMNNVRFLKTEKVRDPNLYPEYINDLTKELLEIASEFKPDVIHLQHLNFGLSRAFINIDPSIPKIAICHGTDTQVAKKYDFFKKNLIEITDDVDYLVFPAQHMADDFFEIYQKEKPYVIYPHGIPDLYFDKHTVHTEEQNLKLLYAGRLNAFKGADIAIQAMADIKTKATLDVIGNEDEPGFLANLHQIVALNSLENKVSLFTQVSRQELLEVYSIYDAILIPSRSLEAFSLTSIEAQARGLPVIYGNGGGITNVVGNSGYLIEDNKPETLAKIIDTINDKRTILKELREKGYKNAEKFRLSTQVESLINLSHQLVVDKD